MASAREPDSGASSSEYSSSSSPLPIHYALYAYHANRPNIDADNSEGDKGATKSVAEFLQREATSNNDFSLSEIVTDLSTEQEQILREFIARKLSRGTVYGGSGNVGQLLLNEEDFSCYFYLLRQTSLDLEAELDGTGGNFYTSQEYVVCFISNPSAGLEIFRPELDAYCEGMSYLLDQKTLNHDRIRSYLAKWFSESAEYVCRCVNRFQKDIAYLITAALMEVHLEIQGANVQTKDDVKRFMKACSLSELLQKTHENNSQNNIEGMLIDLDVTSSTTSSETSSAQGDKPVLKIEGDTHKIENAEKSSLGDDWATAMLKDTSNPAFLRQIIEDFKLKTIQDLNTLKRLVRQAETDHYALYRAFSFLRDCGSGAILLRQIWKDENSVTVKDTQNVLRVLEDFIKDTNGFKRD
ncbi:Protein Njmu-R1 [Holothuria leucospilota]|uniref:Protein Njmu-R1 n=1 Tax=Holothuria leucospilota TaxID=206669 RepID=A0A9Q1H665_HOLLE|nr:Protein Njmu-R1 [Holothuria leucospilota]